MSRRDDLVLRAASAPGLDPHGQMRCLAPDPGGVVGGIALAGCPFPIWQHWQKYRDAAGQEKGRPVLCGHCIDGQEVCDLCLTGDTRRWKGFLPIRLYTWQPRYDGLSRWVGGDKTVVLEVTREAWQVYSDTRSPEARDLMGWMVKETREKGSRYAPCRFYRFEPHDPKVPYVDVRPYILSLYRVKGLAGEK